jgi:hypothetical protein
VLAIALESTPESLSEEEFNRSSVSNSSDLSAARPSTH